MGDKFDEFFSVEDGCEAMKWISVKDELPDNNQRVVFADIGHGEIYSIVAGDYHYGMFRPDTGGLYGSNYDGGAEIYLDANMDITHWMPLPKPTKDE